MLPDKFLVIMLFLVL